jgi:hypothetical protein
MSNPNITAFFKGQLDALTLVCEHLSSGAPAQKTVDAMQRGPEDVGTEKPVDWAYQGGYRAIMAAASILTTLSEKNHR